MKVKLVGNDAAGIHGLQPVGICSKIRGLFPEISKYLGEQPVTRISRMMLTHVNPKCYDNPSRFSREDTQSNRSNPRLTLISLSSVCPRSFNLASFLGHIFCCLGYHVWRGAESCTPQHLARKSTPNQCTLLVETNNIGINYPKNAYPPYQWTGAL